MDAAIFLTPEGIRKRGLDTHYDYRLIEYSYYEKTSGGIMRMSKSNYDEMMIDSAAESQQKEILDKLTESLHNKFQGDVTLVFIAQETDTLKFPRDPPEPKMITRNVPKWADGARVLRSTDSASASEEIELEKWIGTGTRDPNMETMEIKRDDDGIWSVCPREGVVELDMEENLKFYNTSLNKLFSYNGKYSYLDNVIDKFIEYQGSVASPAVKGDTFVSEGGEEAMNIYLWTLSY